MNNPAQAHHLSRFNIRQHKAEIKHWLKAKPKLLSYLHSSIPKFDVRWRNAQTEYWMRANPNKVTYLADGISTNRRLKHGMPSFKR
ncbi:hypothetical protein [Psychrobacter sp. I-STPA10]|uniref:hypothetical protein n=1 Tax=Psychrobacter sp. I-STPA10 TaxID=2585769 RepID=UPI001E55EBF7|nr:hypothetical protein [Psychrobacter sp. I-STPA10]